MTVGKIITTMTLIEKQLDQVLEFSQLMNESVVGEMREIRKRVGAVQQTLEVSFFVGNPLPVPCCLTYLVRLFICSTLLRMLWTLVMTSLL